MKILLAAAARGIAVSARWIHEEYGMKLSTARKGLAYLRETGRAHACYEGPTGQRSHTRPVLHWPGPAGEPCAVTGHDAALQSRMEAKLERQRRKRLDHPRPYTPRIATGAAVE